MGALAALAVPLAACAAGYSDESDPLAPLAVQARADAEAATTAAAAGTQADIARQVAEARTAHAQALQAEVDRLNRPQSAVQVVTPAETGFPGLKARLATAREQAEKLVSGLEPYRAGLVAAVAAGCAGLQEVGDQLGPGSEPADVAATQQTVPSDAIAPLQKALDAEHAAVWVYSLVSAFLPANYTSGVDEGTAEHKARRDACVRMLTAAGATPDGAEPAYLTPKPVTDATSAKSVVATAEADTSAAWRGVVESTTDSGLRAVALNGLIGSARRGTRWREAAGETPTAVPLPGTSA